MHTKRTRRRGVFKIGVATTLVGLILALVGTLAAPAGAKDNPGPPPEKNPDCTAIEGTYTIDFKIDEEPQVKIYKFTLEDDPVEHWVDITKAGVVDGVFEFDWESDLPWEAVIVKQANDAHNFYYYDPAAYSDTGLHPQLGQNEGGISHVTFCGNVPEEPCPDDQTVGIAQDSGDECEPPCPDGETLQTAEDRDECEPPCPDPVGVTAAEDKDDECEPPYECPEGTEWSDENGDEKVTEDECEPPFECPEGTEWTDVDGDEMATEDECEPPAEATLEVTVLSPICDGDVPYLLYQVDTANVSDEELANGVDMTWVNPDGDDVVFTGLPMSGKVLWPGAVVDDEGNAVDWPGWSKLPDGTWVEGDEFDWVRPNVQVIFAVNPEITVDVAYPPSTPGCTDPEPPEVLPNVITPTPQVQPQVQPQQLPRTGSSTDTLTLMGLGMVLIGAGALLAGRREVEVG